MSKPRVKPMSYEEAVEETRICFADREQEFGAGDWTLAREEADVAIAAIEAEAVNAALDKVAAEVRGLHRGDYFRQGMRSAVLAAIEAARPKP